MNAYLALAAGLVCAGFGGELFVRGTVGIAVAARIPPGIIAATIAAFATSSPELTVAITSSLAGTPEIALGDALGSNVVNVALILGLVILIAPLKVDRSCLKRDYPGAIVVSVLVGALMLDGQVSRLDGVFMILAFLAWLVAVLHEVRKVRSVAPAILGETRSGRAILEGAGGLALLIAAGSLIVTGATGIAASFGLSEFVIGATVVAVGTSVPELATAIISRLRGHDEVGLGTILGSNIFNGLFIAGIAASITPITADPLATAIPLVLAIVAVALVFPPRSGLLDRWRGGMLLAVYVAYVIATLQVPAH